MKIFNKTLLIVIMFFSCVGVSATHDADGDHAQRRITQFQLSPALIKDLLRTGPVVRVPVEKLLQGGDDGLEGEYFHMFRTSTPFSETPHVQLFQAYAADKAGVLASDLSTTPYFAHAVNVRDRGRHGHYFGAKSEAQITALMIKRLKGFDTFGDYEPVKVRKVKDSDHYTIIDGHHRAAMALARGDKDVDVVVVGSPTYTGLQRALMSSTWAGNEKILYQPIDAPELGAWTLVRKCTDRFGMMQKFLKEQGLITEDHRVVGPTSYIDFGSDLGWFVKQFTNMGFDAYGLDRDEPANQIACHKTGVPADKIITQELVAGLDEFIREGRTFDCTSCLSVLHHFVRQIRGNEGTSADETLSKLAQVTGRVMFYDMGQDHEKVKGFTPAYIQSWLQEKGRFREVIALGVDTDNVGKYRHAYKRTLFACLK